MRPFILFCLAAIAIATNAIAQGPAPLTEPETVFVLTGERTMTGEYHRQGCPDLKSGPSMFLPLADAKKRHFQPHALCVVEGKVSVPSVPAARPATPPVALPTAPPPATGRKSPLVGYTSAQIQRFYGAPTQMAGDTWAYVQPQGTTYVFFRNGTVYDADPRNQVPFAGAPSNYTPPSRPRSGDQSSSGTDSSVRDRCAAEWPDDFRMRAYCEQKQREALENLAARSMTSGDRLTIRDKCAREWGTDYRMRDYCEEKQLDALDSLR